MHVLFDGQVVDADELHSFGYEEACPVFGERDVICAEAALKQFGAVVGLEQNTRVVSDPGLFQGLPVHASAGLAYPG